MWCFFLSPRPTPWECDTPAEIEGEIVIDKSERNILGRGSYGAVYRARIGSLPCAAKILHPTLFQVGDPGTDRIRRLFEQECQVLHRIRHPHIIQYIKSYEDPETRLPVLLMELLDESLTHYLERVQSVRHHMQINLAHDIGLALEFLHSLGIIHRDLSSNNVLLVAGKRAKVSDFGMVRLWEGHTHMTPVTFCPGTMAYMPPEALIDEPVYHAKLDCFSVGVLLLQILTRQFPDPGRRVNRVIDPRYPTGIEVIVPERERRQAHIALVPQGHPLLLLALDCLRDEPHMRPSAREICSRVDALKGTSWHQYVMGQEAAGGEAGGRDEEEARGNENDGSVEGDKNKGEGQEELVELRQVVEELQSVLEERDRVVADLQSEVAKKTKEVEYLRNELISRNEVVSEKLQLIQELREDLQQALEQAEDSTRQNAERQQQMQAQERPEYVTLINSHPASGASPTSPALINLQWRKHGTARKIFGDSCAVFESVAYFADGVAGNLVVMYNSRNEEWVTLPQCPKRSFAIAVVNGLLTAIGGFKAGEGSVKTLLSLTGDGPNRKWKEEFPAMTHSHNCPAAATTPNLLVVIGGYGSDESSRIVEVMDTNTMRWTAATSLPFPLWRPTAVICGDRLYLGGGFKEGKPQGTHSVLTCQISDLQVVPRSTRLLQSLSTSRMWKPIAKLPVTQSTLVPVQGHVLSIGGLDSNNASVPHVYLYSPTSNVWRLVGSLTVPRSKCFATVLLEDRVMVVGGCVQPDTLTDTIEMATIV